jgi:cytochrome c oxidase subunit II
MQPETHTGLDSPPELWWKPAHKSEKVWVAIAFAWCMVLFAMMPLWHWKGGQNPAGIRHRTTPEAFMARVMESIEQYQTGDDRGMPIVSPPAGAHVYLAAFSFQWIPILRLQKDVEYTLHLSSLDVNHGFSLYPLNVNFQVVPGYDYGLRVTPNSTGDFRIICNEFCGIGHHTMVGRVIVEDAPAPPVVARGGAR